MTGAAEYGANVISPQAGFQMEFASSGVDVVFGGGNLGGGKSFALVLALAEPLMRDPDFRCMISRRSLGNQKAGGGFVEKFKQIFGTDVIRVKESDNPRVTFPCGSFCDLTYLDDSNMDKLRERAKGWEYDVIAIDELTEMSWEAFSYVMTRNRGQSKTMTGRFFATMNPKRSHWLRIFLDWYIGVDGFIIPERDGYVRYFYVSGPSVKDVVWGDTKDEVYERCRIDIDRKLRAIGGDYTYRDMIRSFVFYQGKLGMNKKMLERNSGYLGSVSAVGGKMAQALFEGNWNVDAEEETNIPIPSDAARGVFVNDAAVNGDRWITVDLADYGTDNMLALVWDGFHVYRHLILPHSTPRDNAMAVRSLAQEEGVGESHVVFDGVGGRYFKDYLPEAVAYMSNARPRGLYEATAYNLKDLCYLRLCRMINGGMLTMGERVGGATYSHQNLKYRVTVQDEFMEECAVVRFREWAGGRRRLMNKREMNAHLGRGRSMDLLDPCAMRMLPCVGLEYGTEIEEGIRRGERTARGGGGDGAGTIYDDGIWGVG